MSVEWTKCSLVWFLCPLNYHKHSDHSQKESTIELIQSPCLSVPPSPFDVHHNGYTPPFARSANWMKLRKPKRYQRFFNLLNDCQRLLNERGIFGCSSHNPRLILSFFFSFSCTLHLSHRPTLANTYHFCSLFTFICLSILKKRHNDAYAYDKNIHCVFFCKITHSFNPVVN